MPRLSKQICLLAALALLSGSLSAASGADGGFAEGIKLYNQKNYRAATVAFERAMQSTPSNANVVYYCAVSNQLSGNRARARQLFDYIVSSFPGSQVAQMSAMALRQWQTSSSQTDSADGGGPVRGSGGGAGDIVHRDYLDYATPTADLAGVPSEVRVPFERKGAGVYVEVSVNGQPIQCHFDTGAPDCCFGANHLQALGVARPPKEGVRENLSGVGDRKTVQEWEQHVDLKLGPIYRRNFPIAVQDYLPGEPLLGQTFFKPFYVTIDDDSKTVTLRKKTSASVSQVSGRDYYSVPFSWEGGHMIVSAEINGKPYQMIFDTGADGVAFTARDLQRLKIELPDDARAERHTGTGGETRGWGFTVGKIKLGPIVKEDIKVSMVENSNMPHPLLGQTFFSDYQYTIDNESKLIKFRPPK